MTVLRFWQLDEADSPSLRSSLIVACQAIIRLGRVELNLGTIQKYNGCSDKLGKMRMDFLCNSIPA